MNRFRVLLIALLAIAISAILTVVIYRQTVGQISSSEDADDDPLIAVAAERLPLGTLIEEKHIKFAPWAREIPLEGSFTQIEEVVGRGVVIPLFENEPILEAKLAPREAGAGLTSAIPQGMRAVSVKVNEVIGVAGFVLPGTRVDVIVTGAPDSSSDTEISKVVLENIEVLAAGQNIERDARGTPQKVQVVTMLVTPDDAQKLALASSDAKIQLALRNPMDLEATSPDPIRRSSLYSGASAPAPPPAPAPRRVVRESKPAVQPTPTPTPPKVVQVELISGTKRETTTVQKDKPEPSAQGKPPW